MDKTDKKKQLTLMQDMVNQRSWVKTPWKFSKYGAGLSLIQQQTLFMVSEYLQPYINRFYELGLDKAKGSPKALFSEHVLKEGIPPFRIYLQDLGIQPNNYNAARKAIEEINLHVESTEVDDSGLPTGETTLTNVFSQFKFEETGEYYHFDGKGGRDFVSIRQQYIDAKINPDVALTVFDMSKGYVNHMKMIAMYSTKRSTPRIYLMLMRALKKDMSADLRISLAELKEYLGIQPYFDKAKGKMIVPYPMFSNFKQKVLDAVQEDLQRMAAEVPPQTDITFTYELQYPTRRAMGNPEAVIFHIERTSLGLAYNVIVNHAKMPVEQDLFTADPQQQPNCDTFHRAMREIKREVTKDLSKMFSRVQFISLKDGCLQLGLPDEDTFEWIEGDNILRFFLAKMKQHFGDIRELRYKVGK